MTNEHDVGETVAYTERGFRIFLSPMETRYGTLSMVESSLAGRGAHVRIYQGDGCVHVNVEQAILIRDALDSFVLEAETDALTEPVEPWRDGG